MSELGSEDGAPPPRVASAARPGAVRLTQLAGGQFVLSPSSQSQAVPPLTQITNVTSTNTLTSQSTVTRVVSTSSTSSITSGTQIGIRPSTTAVVHQTIVNALTKTRPQQMTSAGSTSVGVMRTLSGVFTTPSSPFQGNTPIGSPAKKRLKLSDGMEIPVGADETVGLRRRILEHKLLKLQSVRESYLEHVAELFFLQHGGDATNYSEWRKRPHSQAFTQFIQNHTLETPSTDDSLHDQIQLKLTANQTLLSPPSQLIHSSERLPQGAEIKITGVGVTPVAVSTTLPAAVAQLNQQGGTPLVPESSGHSTLTNRLVSSPTSPADKRASSSRIQSASALALTALSNKNKTVMAISVQNTNSSSQEQIVEKAKQEAYVMQRISELQREGLWAERRLPRVQEPPRSKVHWDYLLEEMVWLSADFAQERKWKKAAAKKCARMVQKYFQDKAAAALKAEKAQELHMRRICAFIAKEVRTFWANAQKLVEFKQQTRLEEKRKQALDQHLSFIVDQTEKYSQLLAEGMNKSGISGNADVSVPASVNSSRVATPTKLEKGSDDEFSPGNQSSSDDEETIAQAEAEAAKEPEGYLQEVAALQRESELDLDSFLKELPPNYLENRDKINLSESENSSEGESDINDEHCNEVKDDEFLMESDNEESDIEDTILEQEQVERNEDHKKEIDELKKLGEMSIEELKKMYSNLPPFGEESMDVDVDSITHDTEMNKEDSDSSNDDEHNSNVSNESVVNSEDETDDSELSSDVESQDEEIGLKLLLDETGALLENSDDTNKTANKDNLINDVAALAESIQPKGNTLSSTSVVTPIPFLLKHHLREYQHIGLDWLVTMFERKLNGILADEMGLGKTIQTIALLAHLACEKEDWGPHLIIVPTSVMLNWEMECKKWCPGFKILTYYGTQKERKLKRTGWTKPNAFHICITSYKLVIQDHQSFRRKKWKYLILDEAQNIKNFKSQRWQLLLNFQTQQRLLLTGTPLQNNLMELWSLMHFLMPHVFQSHREFKEWFSNPVTGMIEGNSEYNESIIKRLHKVLRPFLLRRLKSEVEKQMPKKYEHIVMCRLSKRQRYLYDDFMSRAKTKETLATGNLLSVINVLMQLRKVCNHPNLFEVRPTISPFQMEGIQYSTASLVYGLFEYGPMKHINLFTRHILLSKLETFLSAVDAHRIKQLGTPRKLIEEIDTSSDPPPPCPKTRIKLRVKLGEPKEQKLNAPALNSKQGTTGTVSKSVNSVMKPQAQITTPVLSQQGIKLRLSGPTPMQSYSLQLVQHGNSLKAISLGPSGTTQSKPTASGDATLMSNSTQSYAAQIVQTSSGKHILLASSSPSGQTQLQPISTTVMTSGGQRVAVLSKSPFLSSSGGNMVITPTTTRAVLLPSGGDHSLVPKISQPISNHTTTNQETVQNVEKPLNVTSSITISQPLSTSLVQQLTQNASTHSTASMSVRETVTEKEQSLQSEFYDPKLEQRKRYMRNTKLRILARFNEERCSAFPLYGEDLRVACDVFTPDAVLWEEHPAYRDTAPWTTRGYAHCREAARCAIRPHEAVWRQTKGLCEAIHSVSDYVNELKDILDRFVFFVPAVQAPTPKFHVSHPPPGKLWTEQVMMMKLQKELTKPCALLHTIVRNMVTQFPDPRLIQFDCGKLQTLDRLLRKLKTEGHRVLIFTQMTRMLDVLESFLNYHGHIYLRLDGTTRVDQRQVLMERFNGDKRIFAFILSTRSGGVGVNLTGADTVIFYDSDWNPTMDAQAQDRCHRIGQTRDVHIYRLVSEKTIEENILKKANQKRMLGDLAIEGGNFTTAYFKSSTIQDLFNIDANEDASTRMAEIVDRDRDREKKIIKQDDVRPHSPSGEDRTAVGALENALAACEDEQDVQAARTAKAEAVAELAEFDESIPLEEDRQPETTVGEEEPELSKAEQEVENLVKQLTPIEQYAMRFVEANEAAWSAQQLAAVEAEIEAQKREWEANRLVALQEEEEARKQRQKEDDEILTFSHEDATNQVNNSAKKGVTRRLLVRNKRLRKCRREGYTKRRKVNNHIKKNSSTNVSEHKSDDIKLGLKSEIKNTQLSSTYCKSLSESCYKDLSSNNESTNDSLRQHSTDSEISWNEQDDDSNYSDNCTLNKVVRSKTPVSVTNHVAEDSPRTRSRGTVKINLWTLDVSPILPGVKPINRSGTPLLKSKLMVTKKNKTTIPLNANKRKSRTCLKLKANANIPPENKDISDGIKSDLKTVSELDISNHTSNKDVKVSNISDNINFKQGVGENDFDVDMEITNSFKSIPEHIKNLEDEIMYVKENLNKSNKNQQLNVKCTSSKIKDDKNKFVKDKSQTQGKLEKSDENLNNHVHMKVSETEKIIDCESLQNDVKSELGEESNLLKNKKRVKRNIKCKEQQQDKTESIEIDSEKNNSNSGVECEINESSLEEKNINKAFKCSQTDENHAESNTSLLTKKNADSFKNELPKYLNVNCNSSEVSISHKTSEVESDASSTDNVSKISDLNNSSTGTTNYKNNLTDFGSVISVQVSDCMKIPNIYPTELSSRSSPFQSNETITDCKHSNNLKCEENKTYTVENSSNNFNTQIKPELDKKKVPLMRNKSLFKRRTNSKFKRKDQNNKIRTLDSWLSKSPKIGNINGKSSIRNSTPSLRSKFGTFGIRSRRSFKSNSGESNGSIS